MAGMRYSQVLDMVDWTEEKKKEFEQISLTRPHVGLCWTDTDGEEKYFNSTKYPNVEAYEPPKRMCNGRGGNLVVFEILLCLCVMFSLWF